MKDSAQALKGQDSVSSITQPKVVSMNDLVKPVNGTSSSNGPVYGDFIDEAAMQMKMPEVDGMSSDDASSIRDLAKSDILDRLAGEVSHVVDSDPKLNYEGRSLVHVLILPLSFFMTVWAFLKTAGWAILTYIRHEELVYVSKKGVKKSFSGKKTIVKWFNVNAAMRVWYSVPQEKRGEVLKPKYASLFYDRFSEIPKLCRHGAASWKALDLLYSHTEKFGKDRSLSGVIADLWMNLNNSRAVRNRHRLIVRELRQAIINTGKKNPRVLSVACGSAEAVIQVARDLKLNHGIVASLTLLDLDAHALAYARKLAEKYGISDQLVTINENIKNLEKVVTGKFDVIEMLGFEDYLPFKKAVSLLSRLRAMLAPLGTFLTCNIVFNYERHFLRWVISWYMIYRKPQEVAKIMLSAGYEKDNVKLISEPIKIHVLAVCTI